MESLARRPFQGVENIIRFNWHFFILAFGVILAIAGAVYFAHSGTSRTVWLLSAIIVALAVLIPLLVSWYVYDHSGLYQMHWLDRVQFLENASLKNIHAGFDESSSLLAARYPGATMQVYDFYDPLKHTEVSIKRARLAYPAYPGTQPISTADPFAESPSDGIFLILAAHEIRNREERIGFFRRLAANLKPGGRIIVVEHLRDAANFAAYNIGFFHFHSLSVWKETFLGAGLKTEYEGKITPFLSIFILHDNRNTA